MPRSGTTLVAEQLANSGYVSFGRETHFFPCVGKAVKRAVRRGDSGELRQALLRLADSEASQLTETEAESIAEHVSASQVRTVTDAFISTLNALAPDLDTLGEKTPRHLEYLQPILRASDRVRVVICVRDPRAVFASLQRVPWSVASPQQVAARWNAYARLSRRVLRSHPDRVAVVRYEDLVASPAQEIARLLRAAVPGSRDSEPMNEHPVRPAQTYDPESEWWKAGSNGAVHDGSLNRWQGDLHSSVAESIAQWTERESAILGYDRSLDTEPCSQLDILTLYERLRLEERLLRQRLFIS